MKFLRHAATTNFEYVSFKERLNRAGKIAITIRGMSDWELWVAGAALVNLRDALRRSWVSVDSQRAAI